MTNLDWATLIAERDEWVARNFPTKPGDTPGRESILGCIEELGELAHAHLKEEQGIRGTAGEHQLAAQDAIGDLTVYLLGVMSVHGGSPNPSTRPREAPYTITSSESLFHLASHVGNLAYYGVRPMGTSNWALVVDHIVKYLEDYCFHRDWDYEAIVTKTWDHVKQRDWNKHRAEGARADDPAVRDPTLSPRAPLDVEAYHQSQRP